MKEKINSVTMQQCFRAYDKARHDILRETLIILSKKKIICSCSGNKSESVSDIHLVYEMLPPMLHPRSEKIIGRRRIGI